MEEESDGHGQVVKLLQLKNPWGRTEWTGDWSDNDTARWTRRLKERLWKTEDGGDDGIFWMSFDDFVTRFTSVYVCRIFIDQRWTSYDLHGKWSSSDGTAAGCSNHKRFHCNPQLELVLDQSTDLLVQLHQVQATQFRSIT